MTGPSVTVRRELERLLENDSSRVGDVYRHRDKSAEEIARALGVRTAGFVANNRTIIRAVLEGALPAGQVIRGQVTSKVRSLRTRADLSDEAREYLFHLEQGLTDETRQPRPEPVKDRREAGGTPRRTGTLRVQVEEELRRRVRELVGRIRLEVGVEAIDYWSVATSSTPLDAVAHLVRSPGEQGSFKQLVDIGRLDLTLEDAVIAWQADLPLQRELVEHAAAKRDWFSS